VVKETDTQLTHWQTLFIASRHHHQSLVDITLSLHFNGHFPGEPWLAGVY